MLAEARPNKPQTVVATGEPYDMKVSSTVWRGVDGKGAQATSPAAYPTQAQKDGAFVPSKTKGVSILGGSLDEVITGLMRTEPDHAA